jgi:uncharacterized protein (TIGR01732 family)
MGQLLDIDLYNCFTTFSAYVGGYGGGYGHGFALVVVLFILLIIIGATVWGGYGGY